MVFVAQQVQVQAEGVGGHCHCGRQSERFGAVLVVIDQNVVGPDCSCEEGRVGVVGYFAPSEVKEGRSLHCLYFKDVFVLGD